MNNMEKVKITIDEGTTITELSSNAAIVITPTYAGISSRCEDLETLLNLAAVLRISYFRLTDIVFKSSGLTNDEILAAVNNIEENIYLEGNIK